MKEEYMIQANTEEDYVRIVEKYSDMMYRVAYQNLMNVTDAEDAVQETFLKLIRCSDKKFKDEEHLKAWLLRVTVNNCKDLYRRRLRHPESPLEEAGEEKEAPKHMELSEELSMLEANERIVLYMYYYEGYTLKEIAKILARKQNTISSQLSRARKKLGEILKEEYAV
jgi:RNA polymerase sigma-70 factor (ECF subfamily)